MILLNISWILVGCISNFFNQISGLAGNNSEQYSTHILYYKNTVKLLEQQIVEKEKSQSEFRIQSNNDKSELAGILHQIKTKMMEKGLVSAEELDEYKAKTYELQTEIDRLKKELIKKNIEASPKTVEHVFNKTSGASYKKDQAVQCIAERNTVQERAQREARILKKTNQMLGSFDDFDSGYLQSLEWTMQIVNLLYLDKYFADIDDLKEGRLFKSLREYTVEWFLCKIGIKKFSEVLLKDFIKSVSEYSKNYERFQIFGMLVGIPAPGKSREYERGNIKKAYFMSPDTHYVFTRILYRLRCGFSPYMPILQPKANSTLKLLEDLGNFLHIEKAKKVFFGFMEEYGFSSDRFGDFSEILRITAEQEQKHFERTTVLKEGTDLKKLISFDGFLLLCLNQYANIRMRDTETMKASFQILETGSDYSVNYEEYANAIRRAQPKRSERWIEQSFCTVKESRPYETLSASDVTSRIVSWITDYYSYTIHKIESPELIENSFLPPKKSEKRCVSIRQMRDPLTNVFLLEQTFKIMRQIITQIDSQKSELSRALEQLKNDISSMISQFARAEFNYLSSVDPSAELWKKYRKILEIFTRK